MAFSPDGKTLAAGSYGTTARVWDVGSGELLHELDVSHGVEVAASCGYPYGGESGAN